MEAVVDLLTSCGIEKINGVDFESIVVFDTFNSITSVRNLNELKDFTHLNLETNEGKAESAAIIDNLKILEKIDKAPRIFKFTNHYLVVYKEGTKIYIVDSLHDDKKSNYVEKFIDFCSSEFVSNFSRLFLLEETSTSQS